MLVRHITDNYTTIQYENNSIFQGQTITTKNDNGEDIILPDGYGKFYSPINNYNYSGTWKSGKKYGEGILEQELQLKSSIYTGSFENDQFHGKGTLKTIYENNNVSVYDGHFFNGEKHGEAIEYDETTGIKHTLVYNMGFTNSLKPYISVQKFVTINAMTNNKDIIGPAKIISNNNKKILYSGNYNNGFNDEGELTIDRKYLKESLVGNWTQLPEYNTFHFKGKIIFFDYYSYFSRAQDKVMLYNLLTEYNIVLSTLIHNEKKKWKITLIGEFFIKLNITNSGFIIEFITPMDTYTFNCYLFEKANNDFNKLLFEGKIHIYEKDTLCANLKLLKNIEEQLLIPTNIISLENKKSIILRETKESSDDDSDDSDDSDNSNDYDLSKINETDIFVKQQATGEKHKELFFDGNWTMGKISHRNSISEYYNIFHKYLSQLIIKKDNTDIIQQFKNISILHVACEYLGKNIRSKITIYTNNIKYELFHFPSECATISNMKSIKYNPASDVTNLFIGTEYIITTDSEIVKQIGVYDSFLQNAIFTINYDYKFERINCIKSIYDCQVFNTFCNYKFNDKDLTIFFHKKFNTNETIISYKGQTRKGLKSGIGTEYYQNGEIKYEGEFREDIFNGTGTLYDDSSSIIFTGRFTDGAPDFN
jgi:hypothetical protein